jgi:uncharacterized membrane protein YtjA (UPF0391 family)
MSVSLRVAGISALRSRERTNPPDRSTFQKIRLNARRLRMLGWALAFLVISLIAAVFGFGGVAVAAAGIAKFIFFVFLVLFLASLILHLFSGRRAPPV